MTQQLVVIGGGGFGREVLDVIEAVNAEHASAGSLLFEVIGVLDDGQPDVELLKDYDVMHIGPIEALADLDPRVGYVIAIGDPQVRARVDEYARSLNRASAILIHPSATIAHAVSIDAGTIICAGVRITNHIRIGRHVHLNLNSTVGHDAVLGDYVTLSPLVAISGGVTVEPRAFLGTGAKVNPGVTLGAGCTVGTGAAVIRDVAESTTVVGVPARSRAQVV